MPLRATIAISALMTALAFPSAPADADIAVANPYSPASACRTDFGGTWTHVSDNHRDVVFLDGTKWGDVYLMWNDSTKENCVATIKRSFVGSATYTQASLLVEGSSWRFDAKAYKYYAAVKAPACNKRVQYDGWMGAIAQELGPYAIGGRYTFGNGGC